MNCVLYGPLDLICSFRFSLFSCVSCLCSVLFMSSHSGLWKQRACPGVVLKIAFKNSFENAQEYTGCPTREHAQRMNTNNYGMFASIHNSISDPNYEWAEDSQDIVPCIHIVIVFVFVFVEKVFTR